MWINEKINSLIGFFNKVESVKGLILMQKNAQEEEKEEFTTIKFNENLYEFNADQEVEYFEDNSKELAPLKIFFSSTKCHKGMVPVKTKQGTACRKIY
jgi:hypothetical protein